MTVRLIVQVVDSSAAAHVGGPQHIRFETIDIEHPRLEALLRENKPNSLVVAAVIGATTSPQGGE